jgi:putative FmdB family regulatory protein
MPTYNYECKKCHHEWEVEQPIKEPPITRCPECGLDEASRVVVEVMFALLGTSWARDGYR